MESWTSWILMSFFLDWISALWWRILIPDPRNVVVEFFMLYFHTIERSQFCKTLPFNLPKEDCSTLTHMSSVSPFLHGSSKIFVLIWYVSKICWLTNPLIRHSQPDLASHCTMWLSFTKISRRELFSFAPIFLRSNYFRQNIWGLSSAQFHFWYIFED